MPQLKTVSEFTGKWFALIVVAAGALALITPDTFSGGTPAVPWLLSIIMLGMGMTLRLSDFAVVARRPWALLLGVAAQFIAMPLLGLGIANVLGLSAALTAGMVLVGSAPGGTASNVMVYLAKGDTALSVAMTSVSTLLAPILTPLLVLWLAGEYLPVDAGGLFVSILQIVLVPVVLGVVLRLLFPRIIDRMLDALPLVSVAGITAVVVLVVSASAPTLLSIGALIVVAVVLHNSLGLAVGYGIGRACGLDVASRRAISIEVGMQNSGLAAALASVHFSPAAALPAAIFSVWHNVSGSLLASYWSRRSTGAESEQSFELGVLISIGCIDVDVQSRFRRLGILTGDEDDGRLRAAETVARTDLDGTVTLPVQYDEVQHLTPERCQGLGIATSEYEFTDSTCHGREFTPAPAPNMSCSRPFRARNESPSTECSQAVLRSTRAQGRGGRTRVVAHTPNDLSDHVRTIDSRSPVQVPSSAVGVQHRGGEREIDPTVMDCGHVGLEAEARSSGQHPRGHRHDAGTERVGHVVGSYGRRAAEVVGPGCTPIQHSHDGIGDIVAVCGRNSERPVDGQDRKMIDDCRRHEIG